MDFIRNSATIQIQKVGSRQRPNSYDIISQMSDDVLVLILALMPIKDAVATSILAKRWRYVWRNLRRLNFYGPETFRNGVRVTNEDESEREKFINQVNSVIRSYNHPTVKDFRIRYGFNRNRKEVIDNWLEFALERKVEFLELDLLFMQDLDHIQVDERARNLKRFEIKGNYHLKSICLSNLDLVSFTCKGFHIDLDLAHLSKLKELEIDISFLSFNDVFNQISACALSLQYLSISVDEPEDFSLLEYVPKLPNLKKLRLAVGGNGDDCLLFLASVLNACPNLETFSITPRWISPIIRRKKARDATNPHKHLKLVEIEEYKGRKCDFELAAYIIQTAVSLKKVVVVISGYCMKKEAVLSRAKLIESIMPKGVDLVIV